MQVRNIPPNFHVTGQLRPADISKAAEAGYSAVIRMRPDGEGWGQPKFSEIEAAGKASNIAVHHLPVGGTALPMDQARKLRALLKETQGPVLAFCASGQRCAGLYQMAQQFGG